jgi:hypothetical protein
MKYCYQDSKDNQFSLDLTFDKEVIPEWSKYIIVDDNFEFDYHYVYWIDEENKLQTQECKIAPPQKSPVQILQEENTLLKAQVKAMSERSDFIEDCIAEMATKVY